MRIGRMMGFGAKEEGIEGAAAAAGGQGGIGSGGGSLGRPVNSLPIRVCRVGGSKPGPLRLLICQVGSNRNEAELERYQGYSVRISAIFCIRLCYFDFETLHPVECIRKTAKAEQKSK
jgi:hypothetical protein